MALPNQARVADMAKRKLSKTAVNFVVECRSNPDEIFTFSEIAVLLKEKFDVTIDVSSVARNYYRYMETLKNNLSEPIPMSVERGSEQATVNKPVLPENQRKPQTDLTTLVLGTGVREVEPEPLSSNTNIDQAVGDSNEEINRLKEKFVNEHKRRFNEPIFKHNEPIDPEMLRLLGLDT